MNESSSRKPLKPRYLKHKTTGEAFARINGQNYYLGKFGSERSRQLYEDLLVNLKTGVNPLPIGISIKINDDGTRTEESFGFWDTYQPPKEAIAGLARWYVAALVNRDERERLAESETAGVKLEKLLKRDNSIAMSRLNDGISAELLAKKHELTVDRVHLITFAWLFRR